MIRMGIPRGRIIIFKETALTWQSWRTDGQTLVLGVHSYACAMFLLTCKPNILETDPGPLDARDG